MQEQETKRPPVPLFQAPGIQFQQQTNLQPNLQPSLQQNSQQNLQQFQQQFQQPNLKPPAVDINDPTLTRDIVLVYCPQKVGSTSVVTSIRFLAPEKFFIMHTHDETILKSQGGPSNNICVSDVIKNTCLRNVSSGNPRNIYIIDIYRTPIERKVSEFFHEIGNLHFNNTDENVSKYSLPKLIKRFNDIFPHISNDDYFKEKYNTGFDYEEFDFKKKYILVEKEGVKYIKLRLKDSDQWSVILSDIFNTEIIAVHDYETREKHIGDLYKKFMEVYQPPYNYFKLIENCPQLKCYYDFEERYDYLHKWWKRSTGLYTPFTKEEYKFYERINLDNQYYFRKLVAHYKDDGCLCVNCSSKRKQTRTAFKREGLKTLPHNLHNIQENANIASKNSVIVKLFNEESLAQDRYIVLSLIT